VILPADGPNWQAMRPSRNRAWGLPVLIQLMRSASGKLPAAGWAGLLVGDIAQPRGGPMLTGQARIRSARCRHLADADAAAPVEPRRARRDAGDQWSSQRMAMISMRRPGRCQHRRVPRRSPRAWGRTHIPSTRRSAARCAARLVPTGTGWTKIRAWWGHNYISTFASPVRTAQAECRSQALPPPGEGCGKEFAGGHPGRGVTHRGAGQNRCLMTDLPAACTRRPRRRDKGLFAPGFRARFAWLALFALLSNALLAGGRGGAVGGLNPATTACRLGLCRASPDGDSPGKAKPGLSCTLRALHRSAGHSARRGAHPPSRGRPW